MSTGPTACHLCGLAGLSRQLSGVAGAGIARSSRGWMSLALPASVSMEGGVSAFRTPPHALGFPQHGGWGVCVSVSVTPVTNYNQFSSSELPVDYVAVLEARESGRAHGDQRVPRSGVPRISNKSQWS